MPRSMWDLSSLTRDESRIPCIVRQILYHCTTREVPCFVIIILLSTLRLRDFFLLNKLIYLFVFIFACVGSSLLRTGFL